MNAFAPTAKTMLSPNSMASTTSREMELNPYHPSFILKDIEKGIQRYLVFQGCLNDIRIEGMFLLYVTNEALSFREHRSKKGAEMGKFIRIFLVVFFILTVSAAPLFAAAGGKGGGPAWGEGRGGGQDHRGVPEIDPSLAPSALALISGGLLILKSKSGKKDK